MAAEIINQPRFEINGLYKLVDAVFAANTWNITFEVKSAEG